MLLPVFLVMLPGTPGWWALLLCLGPAELQASLLQVGVGVGRELGQVDTSAMFLLSGSWAPLLCVGVEWSCVCLYGWMGRVHCFLVTCGHGYHCSWEAKVMCATSPAATWFSGNVDSAVEARELGFCTASMVPLVPPPLCVPIYSPLDIQMCRILHHCDVLDRDTFVELWIFYWLEIEERDKGNIFLSILMLTSLLDNCFG